MVEDGFFRILVLGMVIVGGKGISSASLPPKPKTPNPSLPSPIDGKGISSTLNNLKKCYLISNFRVRSRHFLNSCNPAN